MITIITPVFNSVRYIRKCILSVVDQWQSGIEHLIVDGGSSDGTVEEIKNLASEFSHIRWISEPDKGQSDAMNKGIALASQPVISFLNADDSYEPGALAFALDFFRSAPPGSFLVGNCRVLREDGTESMVNRPYPFDLVGFMLDYNFPFNPSAYFYHKKLHEKIGFYDVNDHLTMDIDFLFRLPGKANIQYRDRILGNYVQVSGSKTLKEISAGRNVDNLLKVFKRYEPRLSLLQKLRLGFHRMLGENRGWVIHYLKNPKAFYRKVFHI